MILLSQSYRLRLLPYDKTYLGSVKRVLILVLVLQIWSCTVLIETPVIIVSCRSSVA